MRYDHMIPANENEFRKFYFRQTSCTSFKVFDAECLVTTEERRMRVKEGPHSSVREDLNLNDLKENMMQIKMLRERLIESCRVLVT